MGKRKYTTMRLPQTETPHASRPWGWLIVILVAAAVLRLYGLSSPPLDFNPSRQAETAAIASNFYQEGASFLRPQIDWLGPSGVAEMEFPLYAYLVGLFYYIFGVQEWVGRLLSLIASLGCVYHVGRIGRNLLGEWPGNFAAAMFALTPLSIFLGRAFQPDMLALYFSLLAFDALINGPDQFSLKRWLGAGAALGLAFAMAPPALILLAPALVFVVQREGMDVLRSRGFWGLILLALAPTLAWYHHAYHNLFAESGHTIIGYYTRALADGSMFAHLLDPAARGLTIQRFVADSLLYLGVIFAAGGFVQTLGEPQHRLMLFSWLALGVALMVALPGYPVDPGAFSLWALPPLALLAGRGLAILSEFALERFNAPIAAWLLVLAIMGIMGVYGMQSRGWYDPHYPFYHDAVALRETLPSDALVAVIEEVPRRPEFFYFAQRKGWHLHRDGRDWMDDSVWIEAMRDQGATALAVFTETPLNHPIKYLQVHPTGTYVWSRYEIEAIGFRHLLARLDQPIYGRYRWDAFEGQSVAATDEAAQTIPEKISRRPLEAWQETDALLLDFHRAARNERNLYKAVYNHASERGRVPVHVENGAWLLAASERALSATGVFDAIYSSAWREDDAFPVGVIGALDAGDYRVSVRFAEPPQAQPVIIRALNRHGDALAWRVLSLAHLRQIEEGARPELTLTLNSPTWLEVRAEAGGEPLPLASVVCAPDVQCMSVDKVYQAESLYTRNARVVRDPDADRGTALWGYAEPQGRFFCFGPYFRFPDGIYEAVFRVREPRGWSQADMQVGFYENEAIWQRIVNIWMPELGPQYQEFSVEAYLPEQYQIETRAFLFPDTEAMLDTIRIRQRQRDAWRFDPNHIVSTRYAGDELLRVSASGWILDASMEKRAKLWRTQDLIAYADWSQAGGLRIVDRRGGVYDGGGTYIFQIPLIGDSEVLAYALSRDGGAYGALYSDGVAVVRGAESEIASTVTLHPFPVRDFMVHDNGAGGHILFANGAVVSIGEVEPVAASPDFGVDAARALVQTEAGVYVVDCTGVIHSINEAPQIFTPVYQAEDWIADAHYRGDGEWLYITRDGERIDWKIER